MQKRSRLVLFLVLCILGIFCIGQKARAGIRENPYITFSPDGRAFTTNAGDTNIIWYDSGYTVYTGNTSTLGTPKKGEHFYSIIVTGDVKVNKWVVENREGHCVHDGPIGSFHGVEFGQTICHKNYYSGWMGYCADCNQRMVDCYFYMSKEAAASIKEINMSLAYYYLCPWCTHLEQGRELSRHTCKSISANQYSVRYHANFGSGSMPKSIHMYNNATMYEGKAIVPQKNLSINTYTREGYEFAGWNTKMDGSGKNFMDGEEIYNLCSGEQESITLYAQWVKSSEAPLWPVVTEQMRITPGTNVYQSGDIYYVKADRTTPFTVSFDSRLGGAARENFQINQAEFRMQSPESGNGTLQLTVPIENKVAAGTKTYVSANLNPQYEGQLCLEDALISEAKRSNYCRNLEVSQAFYIPEAMDGSVIRLIPGAGVVLGENKVFSDRALDEMNGIDIAADGKGPDISGLSLPDELLEKKDGKWQYTLELNARDEGSGLDKFWLEIKNLDNGSYQYVEDTDQDGRISLEMSPQKPLFAGEFTLLAGARDKVGNESAEVYGMDGISVSAYIEKILDPQSHNFKKGESGKLYIQATGYIQRIKVVFPQEWSDYGFDSQREYTYEVPAFMQMEELEFMVPLRVPDGEYTIVVQAYKGEKMVEADPELLTITVSGSVLDEIRTRLR